MKLKPFYQGKLDVFCAIYAVLNALRLTHSMRTLKAREILHETLMMLSAQPAVFSAFLAQETDYMALVDKMLDVQRQRLPLEVIKPFSRQSCPSLEEFWQTATDWLKPNGVDSENRAIILRFSRFDKLTQGASVRHWTTVDRISEKALHLFDSSHEAESIQNMRRDAVVLSARDIDETHRLQIHPESVRLLRLPF